MASRRLGILPPLPSRVYLRRAARELPFPLGEPGCRLFPEAGGALLHGVRALGLGDGDEVLAPAWHQGRAVQTLAEAGLTPRLYEVGPRLEPDPDDLQALLGRRVRALWLVHHLGFPQDAPGWLAWCRSRGLLLLEDATHAWLGTIGDRPLGSFGDLGGFSLRDAVGMPTGAVVVQAPRDPAPTGRSVPAHRRDAFLLRRLVGGDPRARRRANYRTLLAELAGQVPEPFARLPEGAAPFVLPVESDDQRALLRRLERHGIDALDFRAGLQPGLPVERFPNATRLGTRTVGLPVHQELRPQDLARIVAATRTGVRAPAELSLEVGRELAPVRALWTKLAERSRNVFGTWEWASVWWRHYGQDRPLRVAVVRRGAEPVGLLPLYQWRSGPVTVLRFLGHGPGDELGPVGDPDEGVLLACALRRSLHRLDADLLLAEQLPRGQDWGALLGGRRLAEEASPVVRFGAGGWEEYLRGHSANFREQVRRRARKLAREHRVAYRLSDGSRNLDRDLDILFRLHHARWSGTPTNFLADAAFHRAFALAAAGQGWLRLWFLEVDGEAVAALYGFRFAGTESYYQAGRDPAWNDYRVGFVLLAHAIRQAAEDGVSEYRLLRGGEDYKLRFAVADPGLETVALSRGPVAGAALPALAALRTAPGPLGGVARRMGAGMLSR
jgi:dTDP-4-amino-4,6-dideoxygalactose transaminase/CelD/BcsL family acetyltransferase involved in cellulose biosynthesis